MAAAATASPATEFSMDAENNGRRRRRVVGPICDNTKQMNEWRKYSDVRGQHID